MLCSEGDKVGEENRKTSYNAAVVSVSCVPRVGSSDWFMEEPRLCLHHSLSFNKDTFLNPMLIRKVWEQNMTNWRSWYAARQTLSVASQWCQGLR